jgi:hypothetical protein
MGAIGEISCGKIKKLSLNFKESFSGKLLKKGA